MKKTDTDFPARRALLGDSPIRPCRRADLAKDHPAILFDQYWRTLAEKGLPSRSDLDPTVIARLLKWIMILEQGGEPEGPTFTVRLHGTAEVAFTRGDMTGRELSEFVTNDAYRTRLEMMQEVILSGQPKFGTTVVRGEGFVDVPVSFGMFPFRAGPEGGYQVIVVAAPDERNLRKSL